MRGKYKINDPEICRDKTRILAFRERTNRNEIDMKRHIRDRKYQTLLIIPSYLEEGIKILQIMSFTKRLLLYSVSNVCPGKMTDGAEWQNLSQSGGRHVCIDNF